VSRPNKRDPPHDSTTLIGVQPVGDGLRERLLWAEAHLIGLRRAVDGYLATRPRVKGSMSAVGVTRAEAALDAPVPTDIPLRAGDVIHNLRATLDNLVWEVAPEAVRSDSRLARSIAFLIRRDQTKFDEAAKRPLGAGMPAQIMDAIRTCQVFVQPADGGLDPADANRIALLEDFWNDDKHRVPTAAFGVVEGSVPAGAFTGTLDALVRTGARLEVRFNPQRSSAYMTLDDFTATLRVIRDDVLPRVRSAV
jgi:hypothetical protein